MRSTAREVPPVPLAFPWPHPQDKKSWRVVLAHTDTFVDDESPFLSRKFLLSSLEGEGWLSALEDAFLGFQYTYMDEFEDDFEVCDEALPTFGDGGVWLGWCLSDPDQDWVLQVEAHTWNNMNTHLTPPPTHNPFALARTTSCTPPTPPPTHNPLAPARATGSPFVAFPLFSSSSVATPPASSMVVEALSPFGRFDAASPQERGGALPFEQGTGASTRCSKKLTRIHSLMSFISFTDSLTDVTDVTNHIA